MIYRYKGRDYTAINGEMEVYNGLTASIPFYVEALNYREPIVTGSLGSRKANWVQALDLLSRGKVLVEDIANVRMPMDEWKTAFDRFRRTDGGKFLLYPFKD